MHPARGIVGLVLVVAPAARAGDALGEAWRWTVFTQESGLPTEQVLEIVQAADGAPWARTREGLARYDGFEWHRVPHSTNLPTYASVHLVADLTGGVLVAVGGVLFAADHDGLSRVEVDAPPRIRAAVPLDADRTLVLCADACRIFGPEGVATVPSFGEGLRAGRTRMGTVWASGPDGTFFLDGGAWRRVLDVPSVDVFEDRLGGFVALQRGFVHDVLRSWQSGEVPRVVGGQYGYVAAIDVSSDGLVLVAYESGRLRVRRDGLWSWPAHVPALLEHPLSLCFEDGGDLWVGRDDGLALFRGSSTRWRQLRIDPAVTDVTQTNALLFSSGQELWIGVAEGIFVEHADGTTTHFRRLGGVERPVVTSLAEADDGSIWATSGALDRGFPGAMQYERGTWRAYGEEQGLVANRCHAVVRDRRGRLWFLGLAPEPDEDEPGAFVLERGRFERWGPDEGLPSGRVYAFAEGPDGAYWFATWRGIGRFHDGVWRHWGLAEGLHTERVFCLAVREDRSVYFGHQLGAGGLGVLAPDGSIRYLTRADGLSHEQVNDVEVAADGTLWVGTHNGLDCIRPDGTIASFGRALGLEHTHLWPVLPGRDRVFMGTTGGGVYALSLAELEQPDPRVTLSPPLLDEAGVLFRWHAAAYRGAMPSELVETRTRLDGGAWSPWSRARELSVLGLRSGTHAVEVQAKGLFGTVPERAAHASFAIPPPIHRHPLFVAFVAAWVASLAILGGIFVRRRRRDHRLLRASEEHYRRLVNGLPISIHEVDREGRLLTVNPAGRALLRAEQVSPRSFVELVAPRDRAAVERALGRTLAGEATEVEFATVEDERHLSATFVPIRDAEGHVVKAMGTAQDVSDRERAERERRELEEQLRLAQKMEALGLLAGGVAHDFNNLLTVIAGHASLLSLAGTLAPVERESVDSILGAQERAAALTRQLLAFGRRQVLNMRVVSLNAVVSSLEDMLRRLVGEQIEFVVQLDPDAGHVRADPSQLEQIVVNLAVNGADAMPGGGRLRLSTVHRRTDDGDWIVLQVADEGSGMDDATRARIFEPFFTTKSAERGTGLGLSIVYGIVEQSGGSITVDSAPGRGTTFTVLFPRVAAPHAVPSAEPESSAPAPGWETVLVVDDDPDVRDLVADVLARNGYAVMCAGEGEEAVERARRCDVVHLLVTDVVMPGMNGRELARRIAALHPGARTLLMTGYADAEALGPDALDDAELALRKPFLPEALLLTVREVLEREPQIRAATPRGGMRTF